MKDDGISGLKFAAHGVSWTSLLAASRISFHSFANRKTFSCHIIPPRGPNIVLLIEMPPFFVLETVSSSGLLPTCSSRLWKIVRIDSETVILFIAIPLI